MNLSRIRQPERAITAVPSSNMATVLEGSTPKLRTSCDSCGVNKVKCDRGQPECDRCITLGLTCVYGLSRKFGKPPRKRLANTVDSSTGLSSKKRKVWPTEICENHTSTNYGQQHGVYVQAQHECTGSDTEIHPLPLSISTMEIDEQNDLDLAYFTSLPIDVWPSLEGSGAGLDIFSIPKNNTIENQGSSSALEPIDAVGKSSNSNELHSCPRESYEILRDLICPGPYLHAPEANSGTVCAQLDFVLHFIRDAIDRLARLLKCSCAKSGHRIMVHASIISRILIWYQQAAGWTGSNSVGPLPSGSTHSASPSDVSSSSLPQSNMEAGSGTTKVPTLAQSTGFVVAHVPVSMGTFSIEDQNLQAAVRNQLVLSELKKASNLIDLFASQDSSDSSANGLASLFIPLGGWLRSEHLRIVRVLRTRLRAMNEKLDA